MTFCKLDVTGKMFLVKIYRPFMDGKIAKENILKCSLLQYLNQFGHFIEENCGGLSRIPCSLGDRVKLGKGSLDFRLHTLAQ